MLSRVCVSMFGAAVILMGAGCASQPTLYDRLGGEPAIKKVVDDFVANAAPDAKVNFTRKDAAGKEMWQATPENVAKLKGHLVAFICMATGGPQKYTGRSMAEVHKGMHISESEFGASADDLVKALKKNGVQQKEIDEVVKIVGSTKGDIVGK